MDISSIRASNGIGEAVRASVTGIRAPGSTTLAIDSHVNWNDTFIATAGEILPNGTLDPTSALVFEGHVAGATLIIDSIAPGYIDAGNSVGDTVLIKPTTMWADRIADIMEHYHSDDIIVKVSDTQPAPDPKGSTILWVEPLA